MSFVICSHRTVSCMMPTVQEMSCVMGKKEDGDAHGVCVYNLRVTLHGTPGRAHYNTSVCGERWFRSVRIVQGTDDSGECCQAGGRWRFGDTCSYNFKKYTQGFITVMRISKSQKK